MNEDSKALYKEIIKDKIIPEIRQDQDTDLTQEELDLIGTHLNNEIEYLTQQINETDYSKIRKAKRKKRIEIKKFKKKFDDYSQRKYKYQYQKSILKIEIVTLRQIMMRHL